MAGGACDLCKAALEKDISTYSFTYYEALSFLEWLDESRWRQASHDGSLGATFPIQGVPVAFDAKYGDFETFRERLLQQTSWSQQTHKSYRKFEAFTAERGYDSFDRCVQACLNRPGIYLIPDPEKSTPESILLEIFYNAPPGGTEATVTASRVVGAKSPAAGELVKEETKIKPNGRVTVSLEPGPSGSMNGYLTVDQAYTGRFVWRAPQPPAPRPEIVVSGQTIQVGNNWDAEYTGRVLRDGIQGDLELWWYFKTPDQFPNQIPIDQGSGALLGTNRLRSLGNPGCVDGWYMVLVRSEERLGPWGRPLAFLDMGSAQRARPAGCLQ
ncbi:MAG: hypothetical protein AB7O67_11300 [Vicinamibacterales bacterium]